MHRLITIQSPQDIFPEYRETPIAKLLGYQNLNAEFESYEKAEILVGMCMDNRKQLRIPENFAYILRTGGTNLRYSEFKVSYAVGVGKVQFIALIGHNHCGMVNLAARKNEFIHGLVEIAGWERDRAEEHYMNLAPMFEIDNEIDFLLSETQRLRSRYPKIVVVPVMYDIDTNLLALVKET